MEKCFICGEPAKWEIKVDDTLQFYYQGTFRPVCEEHKLSISLEQPSYIRRIVKSLNEAYMDPLRAYTFARCSKCQSIFKDDVMLYGSILCPNPECKGMALIRGIKTLDDG